MPKVTKILGNNKARAWESLGFAHKKRLCQHFDTTSFVYLGVCLLLYRIRSQFGANQYFCSPLDSDISHWSR